MMPRKDRVGKVIKMSATVFALVALAVWLGIILAALDNLCTATFWTANPCLPAQLAHRFVALGIIHQTSEIEAEHDNS